MIFAWGCMGVFSFNLGILPKRPHPSCLRMADRALLAGYPRYAVYGIVINPSTAEPGYWQNHVDYILTKYASLLLCQEPSAATILSHVNYSGYPFSSNDVHPTILCWFYYIHSEVRHLLSKKFNAEHTVVTKDRFNLQTFIIKWFFYMLIDQHYNM